VQAGRVDHSVGWPTGSFDQDGGLGYPDRQADRNITGSDRIDPISYSDATSTPTGGSVGWPDQPAMSADWLSLAGRGPDGPSNASADEAYAMGTIPLLPKRSARGAGARHSRDAQPSPWSDAVLGGRSTRTPEPPQPPAEVSPDTDSFAALIADQSPPPELDGLPVRVRQASIAPQLRDQRAATQPDQYVAAPQMSADQAVPTEEPSPEAARNLMSAMQRGWERGRSTAEQMTDEPDGHQS
jgi:hypothetical protein